MSWLQQAVASGAVINGVLAVMVIEALLLVAHRYLRGGGLTFRAVISLLLPGACLLLALRAALVSAGSIWILTFLAAAFCAHISDVSLRLRHRE